MSAGKNGDAPLVGSPILPSDVPPMKGQINPTVQHVLSMIVNISRVNSICKEAAVEYSPRRRRQYHHAYPNGGKSKGSNEKSIYYNSNKLRRDTVHL